MREILAPWHAQNANSRLATPADASEDASIHGYKDTYASQFAPSVLMYHQHTAI
ncbi:hypothetical protein EVJ58_g8484 [Rhodofomes roseus]|uniref:Uncharacterized protein n=1 Tax=Rhodofomes roseus TaxID=34475 RepID=A0A4Y9XY79_9APHY|nr:hypothetical protein EVJ58_g8484 [Rhodofomes roseus]